MNFKGLTASLLLGDTGMCVNNLPKVATWQWNGQDLNRLPKTRMFNALINTSSGHTTLYYYTHDAAR